MRQMRTDDLRNDEGVPRPGIGSTSAGGERLQASGEGLRRGPLPLFARSNPEADRAGSDAGPRRKTVVIPPRWPRGATPEGVRPIPQRDRDTAVRLAPRAPAPAGRRAEFAWAPGAGDGVRR